MDLIWYKICNLDYNTYLFFVLILAYQYGNGFGDIYVLFFPVVKNRANYIVFRVFPYELGSDLFIWFTKIVFKNCLMGWCSRGIKL